MELTVSDETVPVSQFSWYSGKNAAEVPRGIIKLGSIPDWKKEKNHGLVFSMLTIFWLYLDLNRFRKYTRFKILF